MIDSEPQCRHQEFDISEVRCSLIEHQLFAGHCSGCGKYHAAQTLPYVPAGQMGPNLIALIAHLSDRYHLSMRQVQFYLYEYWQLHFSLGAISQAQAEATTALAGPYRKIGEHVRSQAVARADETRHIRGSECRWLSTLVIQEAYYFLTHHSWGKVAADSLLGEFTGFLVTDDYAGYNRVLESRCQLCWPHLIRKFVDISERVGNGGRIGRRLLLSSHAVIRTRHRWQNQCINEAIYIRRIQRLRRSFPLSWTFLKDHRILKDDNRAESARTERTLFGEN